MRIIYISTVFPKPEQSSTIYTDLAEQLVEQGHQVTVVVAEERRKYKETGIVYERGCEVFRVKTGNMYDVNIIEKGISIVTLSFFLKRAVKKNFEKRKFDLVLFEAPPLTLASVVEYVKRLFGIPAFLMMKDIFPQNAIDIGMMRKDIIYYYFKLQEKKLYRIADGIGCMSQGNLDYIVEHNEVSAEKLSIFPNTKKIRNIERKKTLSVRDKYGIPHEKVVFVFGGNMGKPQGLKFLCDAIQQFSEDENVFFLLVGRGTERKYVSQKLNECKNARVLDSLPRDEYELLIQECDVGLISLDYRFTIPNFPSRILSYMEYKMPVLAATDSITDFRNLIEGADCGIWCESNDIKAFCDAVRLIANDEGLREKMGENGNRFLKENYDVNISVHLLENFMNRFCGKED